MGCRTVSATRKLGAYHMTMCASWHPLFTHSQFVLQWVSHLQLAGDPGVNVAPKDGDVAHFARVQQPHDALHGHGGLPGGREGHTQEADVLVGPRPPPQ